MIAQRKNGSSGCRRPEKIHTGRIFSETGGLNCFKFRTGSRKTGKRNGKRLVLKDRKVQNPAAVKFLAEKKNV